MKVTIDFQKKNICFDQHTSVDELANYLGNYFPTSIWGDFKIMIDGRIDEDTDIDGELSLPF